MKNVTLSSESWRTPQEQEILDNFRYLVDSGYQWQLWYNGEVHGTFWEQKEAVHSAEHLFESLHGAATSTMWLDCFGGERLETAYANLLVEAPGGVRWMTTPIFIVRTAIALSTPCC